MPDGLKAAIRIWARRLSKPVDPVHVHDDEFDDISLYSLDDVPFLTAAPNTPVSIRFPDTASTPLMALATPERTLKTGLSDQSENTAADTPSVLLEKADSIFDDPESGHSSSVPCCTNVPKPLRRRPFVLIAFLMGIVLILLGVALSCNSAANGWAAVRMVSVMDGNGGAAASGRSTLPRKREYALMILTWSQPLVNLGRPDSQPAERTILLDYTRYNIFVACFKSMFRGDGLVFLGTVLSILTLTLQPLAGALLAVREVFWIGPNITVNSLARIGLNKATDFMDLTSFQAASSFASADVIFNIGPPPFVSRGYTVAEFKLPEGTNGTVYVHSRPAVLSQAACVIADGLEMVNDIDKPLVWHNTAFFGQCERTWIVESNATYLYGVVPASFTGCGEDFDGIPLQYRPILFWFFAYKPQPMASVIMCTPHASGQNVSVAIDLATHAVDVTPLQNSPDDASVANIGPFAYNGVFFDENLDQTAIARQEAIQQQLPGAILEAAKTKDPLLNSTFVFDGFTDLAQDVYTTYLSLIAKSIYFVDDQSPISVRVGANCRRLFLVYARAGIPLPPHLGTLGAAIWLTAQTDVVYALAEKSVGPDKIAETLKGYRYRIHKPTGRIFREVDRNDARAPSWKTRGRVGRWWAAVQRWAAA
ncbi:hypothetical protein BC628DRAFT_1338523 [Trametes gibbosa]|nr:hypothetical protein BC628DRAFT_1338523 [Trametes gibbosa]